MIAAVAAGGPGWLPIFPESASTVARDVDILYLSLVGFAGVLSLVLCALIVYFVVRYRSGAVVDRSDRVENSTRYEIVWITIPTLIALGLFAWAAALYMEQATPPPDAHTIYVVGKQWMWKFKHPNGREEINTLHVPAYTPVRLVLTSQDVIHSLFIPVFRTKQDALPDRYTTMWFNADRPGRYHLLCAEYCGTEHSQMRGELVVMEPAAYQRWLSSEAEPAPGEPGTPEGPLAIGRDHPFFSYGCNSCHLPTSRVRAPRLDGIFGREIRLASGRTVIADEQYIRESILEPQAKISAGYPAPSLMPTYQGQMTEEDLAQLVEFVRSLADGWPEEVLP